MDNPADAPPKSARLARNRPHTEARLRAATEALLVEGGFSALTPSAIGRRAGVDKMLIYRYFGDLPGLIRAIAFAPDFFPTFEDHCEGDTVEALLALPVGARAARILERNARALLARPVVLELMVWELVERNELTAIMEEARELLGLRLMAELFPDVADKTRLSAASAVLAGGIAYLALRRRKIRWFNGLDLKSDDGWTQIAAAIETMASGLET
ncbi:TetR/AcrR family transcriptional regulator [Caulobacter vibrioides]|uniref:Transcriptional regulator, TetR family n=2 Tax=Caulobacter vibrioides TaxID=155892 RepID=Q9A509_CAUVC|nr:TetR/AcrR family transcriptional regulator [Caulobacter vibrioides]YP_002518118.1 TetR-family transcriptional regulator [Caulobacter vibrioides NA1000]AAK24629.1 transcriptional regulator, TetR family [Caulobacter vibrioides CB15]ACL96210.1 TetR-family transcriptional regulator [Caulobacter vibrioides NA1000]ATC30693.1 TetR/AcrR family transcriptional regulator [Caulobacter vibrioides]QXZ51024.1 TetR/AcrR family transcriptional regulator [Caulobacter vibrioides]